MLEGSFRAWIVTYSSPFGLPSVITPFLASTHGMVSPSTVVLYRTLFCTALGPLGELYFSKRLPEPLLFVEPHFPLGTLAIPVCPVTFLRCPLPSSPSCVSPPSKRALDFAYQLTCFYCTVSLYLHSIPSALPPKHPALEEKMAELFLRSLHLYITWASQLILRPLHTSPLLCSFIASPTPLPLCPYVSPPSNKTTTTNNRSFSLASVLPLFLRFFFFSLRFNFRLFFSHGTLETGAGFPFFRSHIFITLDEHELAGANETLAIKFKPRV